MLRKRCPKSHEKVTSIRGTVRRPFQKKETASFPLPFFSTGVGKCLPKYFADIWTHLKHERWGISLHGLFRSFSQRCSLSVPRYMRTIAVGYTLLPANRFLFSCAVVIPSILQKKKRIGSPLLGYSLPVAVCHLSRCVGGAEVSALSAAQRRWRIM